MGILTRLIWIEAYFRGDCFCGYRWINPASKRSPCKYNDLTHLEPGSGSKIKSTISCIFTENEHLSRFPVSHVHRLSYTDLLSVGPTCVEWLEAEQHVTAIENHSQFPPLLAVSSCSNQDRIRIRHLYKTMTELWPCDCAVLCFLHTLHINWTKQANWHGETAKGQELL